MDKRQFIQEMLISTHPPLDKVPAGISYAEAVWDQLTRAGYGQRSQAKPREHKNWYQALGPQQETFDRFWPAFAYKHGKNEAASAWLNIDPDAALAEKIIAGAKAEARKRAETQPKSPIMAQGWLNKRRWEDHAAEPAKPAAEQQAEKDAARLSELQADLRHWKKLAAQDPDGDYRDTINRIQAQINELQ